MECSLTACTVNVWDNFKTLNGKINFFTNTALKNQPKNILHMNGTWEKCDETYVCADIKKCWTDQALSGKVPSVDTFCGQTSFTCTFIYIRVFLLSQIMNGSFYILYADNNLQWICSTKCFLDVWMNNIQN